MHRPTGFWFCLVGLPASLLLLAQDAPEAELKAPRQMIVEGRQEEALSLLGDLKFRHPLDSRPYFYAGLALSESRRLEAALEEFAEARRLNPAEPLYAAAYGHVASLLGREGEAWSALESLNPESYAALSPEWRMLLLDTYLRLSKPDQAWKLAEVIPRLEPGQPGLALRLGRLMGLKGELQNALRYYQQAVEAGDQGGEALLETGRIHHRQGDLESARAALEQARRLTPDALEPALELARVSLAQGDAGRTVSILNEIVQEGTSRPEIYQLLGQAHRNRGELQEASLYLQRFQQAAAEQQSSLQRRQEALALIQQGEQKLEQGLVSQARLCFERILQQDGRHWLAHAYLAESYLSFGPAELALPHLEQMQEIRPDSPESQVLMAQYWYQQGRSDRALGFAERARSLRPSHAVARNLLGNILIDLGRREEAFLEYQTAVELAPDRSDFRANLEGVRRRLEEGSLSQP